MPNMREHSKNFNWESNSSTEHINAGSLQRIADAAEKMAGNYIQLQNDLTFYKRRNLELAVTIDKLNRRISALHGVNTKLKKKLNALQ